MSTTITHPLVAGERTSAPRGPAIGAIAIVMVALYLNAVVSWRQSLLFLVGAVAGVVLYHAAFGFTSAWRVFISDRRGAGLRARRSHVSGSEEMARPAGLEPTTFRSAT